MMLCRILKLVVAMWVFSFMPSQVAAAVLPQQNFLVVTSNEATLEDYHAHFGNGIISPAAFRELVIAMNPAVNLSDTQIYEHLKAGMVLTLPGEQTLQPFADFVPSREPREVAVVDAAEVATTPETEGHSSSVTQPTQASERAAPELTSPRVRQLPRTTSQQVHTVNFGDTLWGIALKYRVDMLALASLNNLRAPYRLVAGQTLLINAEARPKMSTERGTVSWVEAPESAGVYDVSKTNGGDQQYTLIKAAQSANALAQSKAVTMSEGTSHADHLHELLLPSAFVMFCMDEANANSLLAELRQNFDGMLSSDMGKEGYTPVTQYLKDQGYLRSRIESDSNARASYVSSGPRYQVNSLEIAPRQRGAGGRQQHPNISLPVNQFYSPLVEQQLAALAIEWLGEQGYPLADVSDMQWQFDDVQHRVNFQLWYDASHTVQVTAVEHSGANALSPRQLNTLSPFTGSEPYSQSALEQFRSRLMATGYYENVSFELLADNTAGADGHRLEVNTTPAKRNRIQAGVGYAQGGGPVVNAVLTLSNISGNEDNVLLSARTDDFVQQASLTYRRRNLLWYGADVGLSARAVRQDQPYFVSDLVGIDLLGAWHGRDRQDGGSWHVSLGWRSADERRFGAVENQRFEYGRLAVGRSGRGSGLFDFARDWSVNVAHAFSLNPDTDDYWTLSATTDWVLPALFDRHVDLRLGADIRYADNLADIPLSAQLFHGGDASNRGYESASFSSLEFDAESTAYLAYAQVETPWDVNIQSQWLTQLMPFLDLSVMGADGDDAAKMFSSIGLGFAGAVAGYPYRADVAVPLDRHAGKGVLVNFNVGLQ